MIEIIAVGTPQGQDRLDLNCSRRIAGDVPVSIAATFFKVGKEVLRAIDLLNPENRIVAITCKKLDQGGLIVDACHIQQIPDLDPFSHIPFLSRPRVDRAVQLPILFHTLEVSHGKLQGIVHAVSLDFQHDRLSGLDSCGGR